MYSINPFQKIEQQKLLVRNYYDSIELKKNITIQKQLSLQRARIFFSKK